MCLCLCLCIYSHFIQIQICKGLQLAKWRPLWLTTSWFLVALGLSTSYCCWLAHTCKLSSVSFFSLCRFLFKERCFDQFLSQPEIMGLNPWLIFYYYLWLRCIIVLKHHNIETERGQWCPLWPRTKWFFTGFCLSYTYTTLLCIQNLYQICDATQLTELPGGEDVVARWRQSRVVCYIFCSTL